MKSGRARRGSLRPTTARGLPRNPEPPAMTTFMCSCWTCAVAGKFAGAVVLNVRYPARFYQLEGPRCDISPPVVLLLILPAVAGAQGPTVPAPASIKVGRDAPHPAVYCGRSVAVRAVSGGPARRLASDKTADVDHDHLRRGPADSSRRRARSRAHPADLLPGARRPPSAQGARFDPAAPDTFVFSRDPRGNELSGLYRFDLTTDTVRS